MDKNNSKRKSRIFSIIVALFVTVGIVWVASGFVHLGNIEHTNNAQVRQHISPVHSRVQGFISDIRFEEFAPVRKGDTLVIIEDTEYRLRLAQAEADYRNALLGKTIVNTNVNTARNNISVSDASIEEIKILLNNAQTELTRYENLLKEGAVTRQQYDAIKTNYEATQARYNTLLRQKKSTTLASNEQAQRLDQYDATVKLAEAALELARLNLSYTVITAKANGVTGRKSIQEGQLVQPGQVLATVVETDTKWVIANYKETQTTHIEEGMPVEINVDAVPGIIFYGRVKAISEATGSAYSVIPTDNSAGNFVKVEQRIPIRIELTSENSADAINRLRSGMNAECKVKY